jgi:hypothetical protein
MKSKMILSTFEQLSCLKINIHRNELFIFGEAEDRAALYDVDRPVSYQLFRLPDTLSEAHQCSMETH